MVAQVKVLIATLHHPVLVAHLSLKNTPMLGVTEVTEVREAGMGEMAGTSS